MSISQSKIKKCDIILRSINCGTFTMLFHTGAVLNDSNNVGINGEDGPTIFEYNTTSGKMSADMVDGEYNIYTYNTFIQGMTDYYILRLPNITPDRIDDIENKFRLKNKTKVPYAALTSNCQTKLFELYGMNIPSQSKYHKIIMDEMITNIKRLSPMVKLFFHKNNKGATTDIGLLENVVKASVKLCNAGGMNNPYIMSKAQLIYDLYNLLYLMRLIEDVKGSKIFHVIVLPNGEINMEPISGNTLISRYKILVNNL